MNKYTTTSLLNIAIYCLENNAKNTPDKPALVIVDEIENARQFSYQDFYQSVLTLAAGLKSLELKKGNVICIQTTDVYDLVLSLMATMAADCVAVPILLSLPEAKTSYILEAVKASAFIRLTSTPLSSELNQNCLLIENDQYQKLKESKAERHVSTSTFNDPAFIFYTSGSSGTPKGVIHAHHSILGREASLKYWLSLRADDRVMQTDNLCWTYSMFSGFLDPLIKGATAIVINISNQSALAEDKISGDDWLKIIDRYQVSVIASTSDVYSTILNSVKTLLKPTTLRMVGSAGAPLPLIVQKNWQQRFNIPIYTALGMSEISTFISWGELIPYRENSLGKIQPGRKVDVLDSNYSQESSKVNELGMLAVHKDELGLMLGYVGDTEKKSYLGDWFLTQDIVIRDEDGYLYYRGRMDDIVKIEGGFRVSTIEVTNYIQMHPKVIAAACLSELNPDNETNRLVAFVVTQEPTEAIAKDIFIYLRQKLSDYKIPDRIKFVKTIPLNSRGKLIKSELLSLPAILIVCNTYSY